jgi:hypothetical protein
VLAIFMFALVAADLLALFMSAGSLALLCFGKFRVCGAAVLRGRLGGAIGASAPFLPRALRQPRREPIFRRLSASVAAAGFGTCAVFGAAAQYLSHMMRLPEHWADNRYLGEEPV